MAINRDNCPVCMFGTPEPGAIYCSADCRIKAYNLRKRLYLIKDWLGHWLGFKFTAVDNVHFETLLPENVWYAYPQYAQSFVWPDLYVDLDLLHPADYWLALEQRLGVPVGLSIRALYEQGSSVGPQILFPHIVEMAYAVERFKCCSCSKQFIRTNQSVLITKNGADICADCEILQIPF